MTNREMEQLQRLLDKKAKEEQENKAFFTEVKRRRREVLAVLDIDKASYDIVVHKAEETGISTRDLCEMIRRLSAEWIQRNIEKLKEQG